MSLKEISQGYFKSFVENPRNLESFLMYRNTQKLYNNIEKLAKLDAQQNQENNVIL